MSNTKQLNLPWGTLSEAARRMGITRQAMQEAWEKERPDAVEMVETVTREKLADREKSKQIIRQIAKNISEL